VDCSAVEERDLFNMPIFFATCFDFVQVIGLSDGLVFPFGEGVVM
jgi:hypothetical protein